MSEKQPHPDDKLTIAEAAPIARLSESSLYDACQKRLLPHYRLSGSGKRGKILIKRADLDAFMESCKVTQAASVPEELRHIRQPS